MCKLQSIYEIPTYQLIVKYFCLGKFFVVPAERAEQPVRDGEQQDDRAPCRLSGFIAG